MIFKKLLNKFKHNIDPNSDRSKEPVTVFTVVRKSDQEALTFVTDLNQAHQYLNALLRKEKNIHYIRWCECHQETVDTPESWDRYVRTTSADSSINDNYTILKCVYTLDQIAGIMRSVTNRDPIGAAYENEFERKFFNAASAASSKNEQAAEVASMLHDILGVNVEDKDQDPEYVSIIDDTLSYMEDRLIQAGFLPPDSPQSKRPLSKKKTTRKKDSYDA